MFVDFIMSSDLFPVLLYGIIVIAVVDSVLGLRFEGNAFFEIHGKGIWVAKLAHGIIYILWGAVLGNIITQMMA